MNIFVKFYGSSADEGCCNTDVFETVRVVFLSGPCANFELAVSILGRDDHELVVAVDIDHLVYFFAMVKKPTEPDHTKWRFQCGICGQSFESKSDRDAHQASHTPPDPNKVPKFVYDYGHPRYAPAE